MPIIIDGYNVLRCCGLVGATMGPGTLERARGMLLGVLTQALDESERRQAAVVFDSAMRLPDRPDHWVENEIQVFFASGHVDADEMIIEMIDAHSAPKTLLVVSSDHQIQNAAKRRRANALDSQVWYESLLAQHRHNSQVQRTAEELTAELQWQRKQNDRPVSALEAERWAEAFAVSQSNPVESKSSAPPERLPESQSTGTESSAAASPKPASPKPRSKHEPSPAAKLPQASPIASKKSQPTTFDQLARDVQRTANLQDHDLAAADAKPASPQNASGTLPAGAPIESKGSPLLRPERVPLPDVASFDETDYQAMPSLEIGQSIATSNLKNPVLPSEDLEQWLEDFDTQFQASELSTCAKKRGSSAPPTTHRSGDSGAAALTRPAKENDGPAKQSDRPAKQSEEPAKQNEQPASRSTRDKKAASTKTQANTEPGPSSPHTPLPSSAGRLPNHERSASGKPPASGKDAHRQPTAAGEESPAPVVPRPNVDEKQIQRWNRQLEETSSEIFPPGYAEDILFRETFEVDQRIKRRRK